MHGILFEDTEARLQVADNGSERWDGEKPRVKIPPGRTVRPPQGQFFRLSFPRAMLSAEWAGSPLYG